MNLAGHAALAGHMFYMEDAPKIADAGQKQDQGEVLENMCAPSCSLIDQARLTEEQAEELRRRAKALS
jgi:hypothetical protein